MLDRGHTVDAVLSTKGALDTATLDLDILLRNIDAGVATGALLVDTAAALAPAVANPKVKVGALATKEAETVCAAGAEVALDAAHDLLDGADAEQHTHAASDSLLGTMHTLHTHVSTATPTPPHMPLLKTAAFIPAALVLGTAPAAEDGVTADATAGAVDDAAADTTTGAADDTAADATTGAADDAAGVVHAGYDGLRRMSPSSGGRYDDGIMPQSSITTRNPGSGRWNDDASTFTELEMRSNTRKPLTTRPNTTCLPSQLLPRFKHTKN